ncbi:MAG: hypothetical protein IJW19_00030 [Clostridia bacterium]|nr:hypothetical protein [Clostridia bacterium]
MICSFADEVHTPCDGMPLLPQWINKKRTPIWCPILLAEKRRFDYYATLCMGATNHSAKESGLSWSLTASRTE